MRKYNPSVLKWHCKVIEAEYGKSVQPWILKTTEMETRYQFIAFAEARWLWFKLSAMFPGIENKIPNVLNVPKSRNEKHKSSFYTIMVIWADLIDEVRIGCFCLNSVLVQHVLIVSHSFSTGARICVSRHCFEIFNPFSWAPWFSYLCSIWRGWLGCHDLALVWEKQISIPYFHLEV